MTGGKGHHLDNLIESSIYFETTSRYELLEGSLVLGLFVADGFVFLVVSNRSVSFFFATIFFFDLQLLSTIVKTSMQLKVLNNIL